MKFKPSMFYLILAVLHFAAPLVKGRVNSVEILTVEMLLRAAKGVGESLIMHDLTLTKIFDGIANIGIVHQTQNVIVGGASLLLC